MSILRKLTSWIKKPSQESIQVFVRHCHYSDASVHKQRYRAFDKELCLYNLLDTIDDPGVEVTCVLDTFYPSHPPHFIHKQTRFPVLEMQGGNEAASFLWMLDYVASQRFSDQTIIYFLEDDYIHRPQWCKILRESFTVPGIDYVTLYDHKDKYFLPEYQNLSAKIFHTNSCHWRSTPSTTNTYAMKYKTLMRDMEIHKKFSLHRTISDDHGKFLTLQKQGSILISAIPGWATHAEPKYASPCIDWEEILHSKKTL
jgi:hypothetical protein